MEYNRDTKTLIISCDFNEELKDIPKDTQIIIFENKYLKLSVFNQKVDNLPQNLAHLTFGTTFNQKVDNLPQSLTYLTFGFMFNQKVGFLPKNLTHLTFNYCFNKEVNNLPKNIIHLAFGVCFCEKIYKLPKNLKYFKFKWYYKNEIILPKSLKKLSLTCNNDLINNIPEHIEKVYIYFSCDHIHKKVENLPSTIKEIVIEDEQFQKYIKIPFGCIITIKKINE